MNRRTESNSVTRYYRGYRLADENYQPIPEDRKLYIFMRELSAMGQSSDSPHVAVWTSVNDHLAFQTTAEFRRGLALMQRVIHPGAGPNITIRHVHFHPDIKPFASAVADLLMLTVKTGSTQENVENAINDYRAQVLQLGLRFAWGKVVENEREYSIIIGRLVRALPI